MLNIGAPSTLAGFEIVMSRYSAGYVLTYYFPSGIHYIILVIPVIEDINLVLVFSVLFQILSDIMHHTLFHNNISFISEIRILFQGF